MNDLYFLAVILGLLVVYYVASWWMPTYKFKRDIDYLPPKLQKGYHVDRPYTENVEKLNDDPKKLNDDQNEANQNDENQNEYEDEESEDSSEESSKGPEPWLELPHSSLGSGTVAEVAPEFNNIQTTSIQGFSTVPQVYDAQGKSYMRKNGCDVFMD